LQELRGRLKKIEDFLLIIDQVNSGVCIFRSHHMNEEIKFCIKNGKIYSIDKNLSEKFLKEFFEKWIYSSLPIYMQVLINSSCTGNFLCSKEELRKLVVKFIKLEKRIKEFPEKFEILDTRGENLPHVIKVSFILKKPMSVWELYQNNLTISQLIELIDSGSVKIRPFDEFDSLPKSLAYTLNALIILMIVFYILPLNFLKLNSFKINKAQNWALRNKVIGKEKAELPIKGCLKSQFVASNGEIKIINFLHRETLGKLPKKAYKPMFAIPER